MSGGKVPPGHQFTVADMIDAEGGHQEAYDQKARFGLVDDDAFLAILHSDIDDAIERLQTDAPRFMGAKEDAITGNLITFLVGRRYDAWAEPFERGHVDIFVHCKRLRLKWHGEAKIHGAYDTALDGMRQLLTRYTSGTHHHGGFFLYVFRRNLNKIQAKWRRTIVADKRPDSCATTKDTNDAREYRFNTTHAHAIGSDYHVRHHLVYLHFAPKDKSGVANSEDYADEEEPDDENDASGGSRAPPTTAT